MTGPEDRQVPPSSVMRAAAMKILHDAHGDGQLTLDEYEVRAARARAADDVGQLERLVADLQTGLPEVGGLTRWEHVATRQYMRRRPGNTWWQDVRANWKSAPRLFKVTICALLLALSAPVVVAIVGDVTGDGTSVAVSSGITSGLADFREAYEDEFDTTEISNLQIDPDYVRFEVMVETDPPRARTWAWQDDSFSEIGDVRGTTAGVVDLAEVDVAAVDEALRAAVPELGVSDVSQVTTIIRPDPDDDEVRLTLVVRNEFGETARLLLGADGREISRAPFTEPRQG